MTRNEATALIIAAARTVMDELMEHGEVSAEAQDDLLVGLQGYDSTPDSEGGWWPIETAPRDRYILLFTPDDSDWYGNMDVGRWFGDDDEFACFWSSGGPNGGLELERNWTQWRPLPTPPSQELK